MHDPNVCVCMCVSCEAIIAAVDNGARNIDQVAASTGATEGCGLCVNQVHECIQYALTTEIARRDVRDNKQNLFPFVLQ